MKLWPWKRPRPADVGESPAAGDRVRRSAADHLIETLLLSPPASEGAAIDDETVLQASPAMVLLWDSLQLRLAGHAREALLKAEAALLEVERPCLAQHEIGECHLALADVPSAMDAWTIATSVEPAFGPAWLRLAESCHRQSRHEEALQAAERAVAAELPPALRARAWLHVGASRFHLGRMEEAVAAYQAALELEPDLMDARTGLGHAYLWLDEDLLAAQAYEWVCQRHPSPTKHVLLNYGSARQNLGQYEQARSLFQRVIAEHPQDHQARWYLCQLDLLEERWADGWRNYGARFAAGASPYRPLPFKPWDGQPMPDETLLVLADQGIGDEIMFASCIQDAAARCGRLILECEPRLKALFERSFPQAQVIATQRETDHGWYRDLAVDRQIPSGSLPGLFRQEAAAFPIHHGYLRADPKRVAFWREHLTRTLGPGPKVGISWKGGTDRTRGRARSLPLDHWAAILRAPGARFVSLQYGDYGAQLDQLRALHGVAIADFPEAIADYDETAALVAALDVVVTVCTAIVHLAGALGVPVWILAPYAPGWRYTAHATTLAWYPSSRVFRQTEWNDWTVPCHQVAEAVAAFDQRPTGTTPSNRLGSNPTG